MSTYGLLISLCVLSGPGGVEAESRRELQGTWVQTAVETPAGRFLVKVEGGGVITTTFDGEKLTEISGNGDPWRGTFRVDTTRQPREIDMTYEPDPRIPGLLGEKPKETVFRGIYQIENDVLKIVYGLKERPKTFVPTGDDFLIEFQRQKPAAQP